MTVQFNNDEYVGEGYPTFQAGWFNAQITDFGDDVNKSNTGEYVWFEFTLLEGPQKGKTLRSFYNYIHDKDEAQKIARDQICQIARIVDVKKIILPEKLDAFLNKKLRIKINQKKDDDFPQIKDYAPAMLNEGFGDLEDEQFVQSAPANGAARDPYATL